MTILGFFLIFIASDCASDIARTRICPELRRIQVYTRNILQFPVDKIVDGRTTYVG